MRKNLYRGKFIVFEGLDGSGSSTQIKLLGDFLEKQGYQVVLTKEPTSDSKAGRKIKKILSEEIKFQSAELQELFVKDRREHLKKLIIPALKRGKIIISDRYFFSSFAYGSIDLDLDWLIKINQSFLYPDIIFLLKTKPKICLERIEKRKEKIQLFEKKEKLEKVFKNYQSLIKKFKNIYIINGEQSIKQVFKDMKKVISSNL